MWSHLAEQHDLALRASDNGGHAFACAVKLQDVEDLKLDILMLARHALPDIYGGVGALVAKEAHDFGCHHQGRLVWGLGLILYFCRIIRTCTS